MRNAYYATRGSYKKSMDVSVHWKFFRQVPKVPSGTDTVFTPNAVEMLSYLSRQYSASLSRQGAFLHIRTTQMSGLNSPSSRKYRLETFSGLLHLSSMVMYLYKR